MPRYQRFMFLLLSLSVIAFGQQTAPNPDLPSKDQPAPQVSTESPVQPPQANMEAPATVLKVKTRLVVVDVVAVDRKGVPVTDLKADDFKLSEENVEQKVRAFSFQQGIQKDNQPATLVPAALPPNRITNIPRFKTNSSLNILLLDGINVTNKNQKYVRAEMLKFVEKLPPGAPIAVYGMGSKLRLLQDFTTDPSALKEAIKKAQSNTLAVRNQASNTSDLAPGSLEAMPAPMLENVLRFGQDQFLAQMDERVNMTMVQLGSLARNLSGYPGRKNLIWLSEAFPAFFVPSVGGAGSNAVATDPLKPLIKSYQAEIDHTADLLANAQVAVYPVDAGTLSNNDVYSSLSNTDSNGEYLGRSASGQQRIGRGSQQAREINDAAEVSIDAHSTMTSVADQTGGRAFYNTNNLAKAIHESIDDGSTYYTLGYYPENKEWNGNFRKITVKVNRPGLKLHYRQGFFAVEPTHYSKQDPKILAMDMGAAFDINNPVSTALPFQAMVIPPSAENGNKVRINFGIDPHAIGFELRGDGLQHAAIDCGVRVLNKNGQSLGVQGNTFNTALAPEQYKQVLQKIFPCSQTLELPPGEYTLRLAVRDNTNGLIGTANGAVTVPALGEAKAEKKP